MSDELKEITNRLDEMRQEHKRDRYNTYCHILFALALAMFGLSLVSPERSDILFGIFAIVFLVWAGAMWFRARKA